MVIKEAKFIVERCCTLEVDKIKVFDEFNLPSCETSGVYQDKIKLYHDMKIE